MSEKKKAPQHTKIYRMQHSAQREILLCMPTSKKERSQINNLTLHLEELEKGGKTK